VVDNLSWTTEEEYKKRLSAKSRAHLMQKIKRNEHLYDAVVKDKLSDEEIRHAMLLFENVRQKNIAINHFSLPEKLFHMMNASADWEFVMLYLKKEYSENRDPVSVGFCHKNAANVYSPMFIGMDYEYVMEFGVYRQSLYQVVKRAHALNCNKLNLGVSASLEKRKLGATLNPKVGYYQAKDNFDMEMMRATIAIEKA